MKHLHAAFLVLVSASLIAVAGKAMSAKGEALSNPETASVAGPVPPSDGASGPARLSALLAQYDADPGSISTSAIDAAAGQYGAVWSRLYWHRTLEDAQVQARAEGKPILYLRMMGKLTDEYSCANSRFFRTVLYTNEAVSKLLRDKFVLVWESERPVPVITVDYGDGRTLKRTITGNSIHYVLNSDGRIVDALPGLYDPVAFARIIGRAGFIASEGSDSAIVAHLNDSLSRLDDAFSNDAFAAGIVPDATPIPRRVMAHVDNAISRTAGKSTVEGPFLPPMRTELAKTAPAPKADDAMRATMSKSGGERRLLLATTPPQPQPEALNAQSIAETKYLAEAPLTRVAAQVSPDQIGNDWQTWQRLAALHLRDAQLDARSLALIQNQNVGASPRDLDATIQSFQSSLAADTVRNNYEFRPRVLQWLLDSGVRATPRDMNERVYGELFLTPRSDPWLGLAPENTYTALTNEGCSIAAKP
ncbi:MAG: thioredoxin family protein [Phycisphaerae bacterium]|nr:thioredoxin family protein [Phycisphaerae bacterium]